jgi:guanylate kinase
MKKLVILFSGNSCSGKSTVQNALIESGKLSKILTFTTRPQRENEVEGVDYHFISKDEVTSKVLPGNCIEFAKVNGNIYGVEISSVINELMKDDDSIPCAIVTPSAINQYKKFLNAMGVEVVSFYFSCPRELVEKRLIERALTKNDEGHFTEEMIRTSFKRFSHFYAEEQMWLASWNARCANIKNENRVIPIKSKLISQPIDVSEFDNNVKGLIKFVEDGIDKIVEEVNFFLKIQIQQTNEQLSRL